MEVWKDIKGYEDRYQISNLGRVKCIINGSDRIRKPVNNGNGYYYVSFKIKSKPKNHYIHRLVAEAFLENKECKKYVNHIDMDKTNNHVNNLEWCTAKENTNHYVKESLKTKDTPFHSKLSYNEVIIIKRSLKLGYKHKTIAKWFGVTRENIGRISQGVNWKHVEV